MEFERVDITDLDSIRAVVAGATAVFHCASMVDFGNTPLATLRKVGVCVCVCVCACVRARARARFRT